MGDKPASQDFDFAEGWNPSAGDIVRGPVAEISSRDGGYGDYPVVTLHPIGAAPVAVHAFHKVLREKLRELNVQPGDDLGILYKGSTSSKDGKNEYHDYRARVFGREPGAFDWGSEEPVRRDTEKVGPSQDVPVDLPGAGSAPADDDIPFAPSVA